MTRPDDETLRRLRAEIRQKRVDLDQTMDELKETVSVQRVEARVISLLQEEIMERTESMAKEVSHAATHAGAKIYDTISRNLFPTAMAGVGAAWNGERQRYQPIQQDHQNIQQDDLPAACADLVAERARAARPVEPSPS